MARHQFQPYKVSGAYRAQVAQKATWADVDGWRLPVAFGDPADEASRVRRGVGIQDVSSLGKLDVKGTAVDARVADCEHVDGVSAVLRPKPGHALVLAARQDDRIREAVERVFAQAHGCAHVTDITSALAAFALVGPHAAEVLAGLTSIDLRPRVVGNDAAVSCTIAHVHATLYRRDWGELRAYMLLVGRDSAEYVWTTIHHAGEHVGLIPFGTAAQQALWQSQAPVAMSAQAVG